MDIGLILKTGTKFKEYLETNGGIRVTYCYSSMEQFYGKAQHTLVQLNKLIIISRSSEELMGNIRYVISALDLPDMFFKAEEIILVYKSDEIETKEVQLIADTINKFVQEKKLITSTITYELDALSYDKIASAIMGKIERHSLVQQKKYRFLATRDGEEKMVLMPSENSGYYTPKEVFKKKAQESLNKLLYESEKGRQAVKLEKFDLFDEQYDINIDYYDIPLLSDLKLYITTGRNYSGSTVHTCALALSMVKLEKNLAIIDITETYSAHRYLEADEISHDIITNEQCINFKKLGEQIVIFQNTKYQYRFAYLLHILTCIRHSLPQINSIIINIDLLDVPRVREILNTENVTVILTAKPTQNGMSNTLADLKQTQADFLWINEKPDKIDFDRDLDLQEIADTLENAQVAIEVLGHVDFQRLNNNEELATIIGGI